MKKVVKVSIGKIAFTMEEDGYLIMNDYLRDIADYYSGVQNEYEIIDGIEERIAELFIEKSAGSTIISSALVNEVILLLGRPELFEEEESGKRYHYYTKRKDRRLYRDPDNKTIAGVCSGLAAYFNIDVVILRIGFLVLLLLSWIPIIGYNRIGGSFIFLVYIILWIAVPEARTVEQKFAMRGEKPDSSNIQRSIEKGAKRVARDVKRSSFFDVIAKIIGGIMVFLSIAGILSLSLLLIGGEIFKGLNPIDLLDYIELGSLKSIYLKVSTLALLFLPLLAVLYGGIQILFDFKRSKFRLGLIIFILWIFAFFTSIMFIVKATLPYRDNSSDQWSLPLSLNCDTLFIDLNHKRAMPHNNLYINGERDELFLLWEEKTEDGREFVLFPKIEIERVPAGAGSYIEMRTQAFGMTSGDAILKAKRESPLYELKDSLLTISPDIYSKRDKWDGTNKKITIYLPENVKVLLKEPIRFGFDGRINNSRWLFTL